MSDERQSQSSPREAVEYLVVGEVVGAHGIRGELRVEVLTEDADRFGELETVYLGEDHRPFKVERARPHKGRALLKLEGVPDRNAAETYRGTTVYVHISDALPLAEDEYYFHQIEGLDVVTEEGEFLGQVNEVLSTGANEVYVVAGPRGEILLPAIPDVILSVDLDEEQMVVRIPEGLI